MLFFSLFKSIIGSEITVELKDNMSVRGTLLTVDTYLNMTIYDIEIINPADNGPAMHAVTSLFIRGNSLRYVHLPADKVDASLLQDSTRVDQVKGTYNGGSTY